MTHWWNPMLYLHLQELKGLEKAASRFTDAGLSVPESLQMKIARVKQELQ